MAYSKTTNFTAKDALAPGDPNKLCKGSEVDVEFDNIQTAFGEKADKIIPAADNNIATLGIAAGNLKDGGITIAGLSGAIIPAGTKMLFSQAAAPAGWTQDATLNDRVLRVVSGTGAGTGGSWTISGVTVDNHTLTTTEIPSHTHSGSAVSNGAHTHTESYGVSGSGGAYAVGGAATYTPTSTDSAGAHTHTLSINATGGGGGHNHGVTADGAWRPSYTDVIVCAKDAY